MENKRPPVPIGSDVSQICFGLDRATDERSISLFLKRFADDALLAALVPRLRDDELISIVDSLSALLKKHLTEKEYHRLFLGEA